MLFVCAVRALINPDESRLQRRDIPSLPLPLRAQRTHTGVRAEGPVGMQADTRRV